MAQARPPRTLGPGHDEFWEGCRRGELRLQRCAECGHIPWPVVEACEVCGSEALSFERMSGRGRLLSWCTFERAYYGETLPVPWDTILVELEEGPVFLSNPKGFDNAEAQAGMALRVDFIDCEDESGPFSLPVFVRA